MGRHWFSLTVYLASCSVVPAFAICHISFASTSAFWGIVVFPRWSRSRGYFRFWIFCCCCSSLFFLEDFGRLCASFLLTLLWRTCKQTSVKCVMGDFAAGLSEFRCQHLYPGRRTEDVSLVEFMYLNKHACQVRVTVGSSVFVTVFVWRLSNAN